MRARVPSSLPALALALAGCATTIHGTTQDIAILSAPAGAKVSVDGAPAGRTPLTVRMERKRGHQVLLEAEGYRPYEVTMTRHTSGTAWTNALVGLAAVITVPVDITTGGFYELAPRTITAWLAADSTAALSTEAQAGTAAAAQAPSLVGWAVMVGSRVRVSGAGRGAPVVGAVTAVRGDTLEVQPDGGGAAVTMRVGGTDLLERSQGRTGHALAGAGIGLAAGSLVGGLIGAATYTPCTETGFLACMFQPSSRGGAAALGATVGALGGVVVGVLIGAGTRTERWERVPLSRSRVTFARLRGGRTGLGLSYRF